MQNLSDHELVIIAKSGDEAAFSELMKRHYKGVLNYIYRFTNGREGSEDLAQEVFLRVYKSLGKYKPDAKFSTWLYKIATNLCLTNLKKKNPNISLDELEENSPGLPDSKAQNPYDNMYRKEIKKNVLNAINRLPEKERIALTLTKYEGFSYIEAADVLNCSVGAVKTHIYRGRMKLVDYLKDYTNEV